MKGGKIMNLLVKNPSPVSAFAMLPVQMLNQVPLVAKFWQRLIEGSQEQLVQQALSVCPWKGVIPSWGMLKSSLASDIQRIVPKSESPDFSNGAPAPKAKRKHTRKK